MMSSCQQMNFLNRLYRIHWLSQSGLGLCESSFLLFE